MEGLRLQGKPRSGRSGFRALVLTCAALLAGYSAGRLSLIQTEPQEAVRPNRLKAEHYTAAGTAQAATATAQDVVQAAHQAGFNRSALKLGPQSSKWAPMVLTTCSKHMPPHFAPCMVNSKANPGLAYGEELIYPAFSIPEPGFLLEEHALWWRDTVQRTTHPFRFVLRTDMSGARRGVFPAQHGQNLVFRNVHFGGDPPADQWGEAACMFPNVSHHGLTPLAPGKSPEWKGRAVLAGTPLSFILQHFLDRVAKIAAQTEGWRQPGTRIVSGSQPSQPHVVDVWAALLAQNGGGQQAVHSVPSFSAQEVVFPCRCPLIHPFFNERLREIMRLPQPKTLEQRKVVLYFSRNQDGMGNGGERRVTNEDAVLQGIREVLAERNRGEELVMFSHGQFPRVADLARFLLNVTAVVGVHGGALYNVWWAPRDTLLVEFVPKSRPTVLFWEEGSVIGLRYFVIPCDSEAPSHHVVPDPKHVQRVLREQLGMRTPGPPEPRLWTEWSMSEMVGDGDQAG